jgi:short-subunit dehydrogenase
MTGLAIVMGASRGIGRTSAVASQVMAIVP